MARARLAARDGAGASGVRDVVRESWERAQRSRLDPERLLAPLLFESAELRDYRDAHPLAEMMPVIRKLLVRDADDDSGMLIAVGDAMGRLLWVEGDQQLKSRAESMMFVEGSDWSESVAGTSAPGTALAIDQPVQIRREEHFNLLVHPWSCTAVPVHDPESRAIIGVIDITGGDQAVDRNTMPLMEATAHAIENELLVRRMKSRLERNAEPSRFVLFNSSRHRPSSAQHITLQTLGRDRAQITGSDEQFLLSARHSEIVTLLAFHPEGMSAEDLAEALWGDASAAGRLRAEVVRLRKVLARLGPDAEVESNPYRLRAPIETDAQHVLALLDRGAHRAAVSAMTGALLPNSVAPGVEALRHEIQDTLREAVLSSASVEVLHQFASSAAGIEDEEVWRMLLQLLPARSPKRARVVTHLESLANSSV